MNSLHFIEGQKIAKRISQQIRKESTKVKHLVEQYNSISFLLCNTEQLSLTDALDPTSPFWKSHSSLHLQSTEHGPIPLATKQDIIRFYLQEKRGLEEIELLQNAMHNTLEYFWRKRVEIGQKGQELSVGEQSDFTHGALSVLRQRHVDH